MEIVKQIKFERVWEGIRSKILFPETIIHKIFEINYSFHVK